VQGLRECRYPFIARLDADDACLPHRLSSQLAYLLAHPHCRVVGGGALIIPESDVAERPGGGDVQAPLPLDLENGLPAHLQSQVQGEAAAAEKRVRVAMQPCDPWLLSWSLLFSCTLTHSAVMLNTKTPPSETEEEDKQAGGLLYDADAFPAE
jgi:hypothetical protein